MIDGQAVRLLVVLEHLDACTLILDLLLLTLVARPDSRVEERLANADDPIRGLDEVARIFDRPYHPLRGVGAVDQAARRPSADPLQWRTV